MSPTQLIAITNDLFDISSRLKSINPSYSVYYNTQTDRFEVHDTSKTQGNTLAFIVPYTELDARTLDFARYTRVENARKIFDEVEDHNRRLAKEQAQCAQQKLLSTMEVNYAT